MPFDPSQVRSDFPILSRNTASGAELAFLDNAASTQRPSAVIDAMSDCYRRYYANVHRGIHTLSEESTAAYESARQTATSFINAASHREIIFTAGTTAAINTVAHSWGNGNVKSGDVILVTIADHHANIVPWHQLAQRTGCRVQFVPLEPDFTIADDSVSGLLEKYHPKLFAFPATSNVLGTNFPVQRWTKMAHASGSMVLIDAAQAAPHRKVDVQNWDSDFVVFSGHKLCGPTGIGVLYGKEKHLDAMPPFLGGGGMIDRVTTEGFTAGALPEKFEAGTPPIVEAIGLAAAIDYIQAIGLDGIEQHEHRLCKAAQDALCEFERVNILGPTPDKKAGIVSFTMDRIHAHDVAQLLDSHGVAVRAGHHCTMPLHESLGITSSARASFYFYNTLDEVDRLVQAVQAAHQKFAPTGRRRRAASR